MATCASCGSILSDEREQCPQCGAPVASGAQDNRYAYENAEPAGGGGSRHDYFNARDYSAPPTSADLRGPAYIYSTPRDRMVMTTGSFLGTLLLMSLPGIGLILQIIWAAGGAKNQNKRNLARAYLILNVIVALLAFAALFTVFYTFGPYLDQLLEVLETLY